jgi:hypothetical protein
MALEKERLKKTFLLDRATGDHASQGHYREMDLFKTTRRKNTHIQGNFYYSGILPLMIYPNLLMVLT